MSEAKASNINTSFNALKETLKAHNQRFGKHLNFSFGLGLLVGILIASTVFSGYSYWTSLDHRTTVPVTVVTCDSCDYERFRNATDRMLKTEYSEVDYQSRKGQELIQKHNLKYVPGFIFDQEQLEKAENFTSIRSTLAESEDTYVIPDEGIEVAQRLSEGKYLNRSEAE